jgi:hypothetical protein
MDEEALGLVFVRGGGVGSMFVRNILVWHNFIILIGERYWVPCVY